MHLHIPSFSNYVTSIFNDSILPSLNAQQKKILIIAAIAFGFLAASYLAGCFCFKAKVINSDDDDDQINKKKPLSYEDVIKNANENFAKYSQKEAIVERIKRKLKEIDYETCIISEKQPFICFDWEDTLWDASHLNEQETNIVIHATRFLEQLPGLGLSEQTVSYEDVIKNATEEFASHPQKKAIIEGIKGKLNESAYEKCIISGRRPDIFLDVYHSFLDDPYLNDPERATLINVTRFLKKLPGVTRTYLK